MEQTKDQSGHMDSNSNNNCIENAGEVLKPGSNIKPNVSEDDVESLLQRLYGITVAKMKELISYDDRNFLVEEDRNIKNPIIMTWPHGYVLKILNSFDSRKTDFVDAQNQLMVYLSSQSIRCAKPIANVYGKYFSVENISNTNYVVRLLEFIPGKILHQVPMSNLLLYKSGVYLAKVDHALKNFSHIAYESHKTLWMLQNVPQLKKFLYVLKDPLRKSLVEEIIECFETKVLKKYDFFEKQIIHGDYNEQNIIVDKSCDGSDYDIVGLIDFGDSSKSPVVFEVGIALTYMLLQAKTVESGGIFLAGYNSVNPIRNEEKEYLKYCVAARLAQSLTLGAYTHSLDTTNDYVLVTQEQGWKLIEQFWNQKFQDIDNVWNEAGNSYLYESC